MIETVNSKMTEINDTIRDLSGITDKLSLDDMAENLDNINSELDTQTEMIEQIATILQTKGSTKDYDAGVKDENERFWNLIQIEEGWASGIGWVQYVTNKYATKFRGWYTATEINPLYPIQVNTAVSNMFESCQNITEHPPVEFLVPVSTYAMFNGCRKLVEAIGDFRLTGNCSAMFNSCGNLIKVDKLIIEGTVTWSSNAFAGCTKLEEVNIEGTIDTAFYIDKSPNLNKASITNIINILSTTTSGLSCVIAKAAVNKAFETSEDANDGTTSAEWQTLVNSKPNWTISLP